MPCLRHIVPIGDSKLIYGRSSARSSESKEVGMGSFPGGPTGDAVKPPKKTKPNSKKKGSVQSESSSGDNDNDADDGSFPGGPTGKGDNDADDQ